MFADPRGQIERITFTNDENEFTISKVRAPGRQDLVCVVGSLMSPSPGEIIKMRGEWTNPPKFGEQFKIVFYESVIPATVHGIQKYLGSGLIKGIGPVVAKRIVIEALNEEIEEFQENNKAVYLAKFHFSETRIHEDFLLNAYSE